MITIKNQPDWTVIENTARTWILFVADDGTAIYFGSRDETGAVD